MPRSEELTLEKPQSAPVHPASMSRSAFWIQQLLCENDHTQPTSKIEDGLHKTDDEQPTPFENQLDQTCANFPKSTKILGSRLATAQSTEALAVFLNLSQNLCSTYADIPGGEWSNLLRSSSGLYKFLNGMANSNLSDHSNYAKLNSPLNRSNQCKHSPREVIPNESSSNPNDLAKGSKEMDIFTSDSTSKSIFPFLLHNTASGYQSIPIYSRDITSRQCRRRKARTVFSDYQLTGLEHRFESQHYLSTPERIELANRLNLSETQVKTWFQNRRMKHKKMKRCINETDPNHQTSPIQNRQSLSLSSREDDLEPDDLESDKPNQPVHLNRNSPNSTSRDQTLEMGRFGQNLSPSIDLKSTNLSLIHQLKDKLWSNWTYASNSSIRMDQLLKTIIGPQGNSSENALDFTFSHSGIEQTRSNHEELPMSKHLIGEPKPRLDDQLKQHDLSDRNMNLSRSSVSPHLGHTTQPISPNRPDLDLLSKSGLFQHHSAYSWGLSNMAIK